MPEVVRGSRSQDDTPTLKTVNNRPSTQHGRSAGQKVAEDPNKVRPSLELHQPQPTPVTTTTTQGIDSLDVHSPILPQQVAVRAGSEEGHSPRRVESASGRRQSMSFIRRFSEARDQDDRAEQDVYYDSRAATITEFKRRATTLDGYYHMHPDLLPQLPFTFRRGWRRWRLYFLVGLIFFDACILPILLYYAMTYGGNVAGWKTFAIVTTIWGGPTYLELFIHTWRQMSPRKHQRFYRPLGATTWKHLDILTYISILTIFVVTALFIIGGAPHIVWLRVLCMPAPAILYCLGGSCALLTIYHKMGWKAPFRISSTEKGQPVKPGAFYFVEDIIAVNVGAGRPYREALAARYEASPRFRELMYAESLFWSIPALILAVPLTIISVVPSVPATYAYGVGKRHQFPTYSYKMN